MEYRDHRRFGRQLAIFANDGLCGSGLPLWLPAGATVRAEIERFVVELERRSGYQHIYTAEPAKRELYVRSGHWEHFHDDMYPPMQIGAEQVVLRPMNCPHHILVFAAQRSPGLSRRGRGTEPNTGPEGATGECHAREA